MQARSDSATKTSRKNIELSQFEAIPTSDHGHIHSTSQSTAIDLSDNEDSPEASPQTTTLQSQSLSTVTEEEIRVLPDSSWGNTRPLCSIFGRMVIKGPGFQSISPCIMIILLLIAFPLLADVLSCAANTIWPNVVFFFHCFLILNIFRTSLMDPGYVKRRTDPQIIRDYEGAWYCTACMVTLKERKEKKIAHCYDCERCTEEHDHHCIVVGMCIAKKNLWSFYMMIGTFMIFMVSSYYTLFLTLELKECAEDGSDHQKKFTEYMKLFSFITGGSLTKLLTNPETIAHGIRRVANITNTTLPIPSPTSS
jgi:hypothetical protein